MLKITDVRKQYTTGDLVQVALDGVSLTLRDSEFVAVLGPSGSGKTTMLNIVGGLDRYDSGDLTINGVSTRDYSDRDWDAYRNHSIGFVFQSYNLISHQSVLANVELALTISGASKVERRKRAIEALQAVGLGDQLHKRPNQLSGGQMQRVAIARALVNDPEVLLADEPTGALDSNTSTQIMDLLKEVAQDRLVVMVTHNSELAEKYATRIIKLRDGQVTSDSNPFDPDAGKPLPSRRELTAEVRHSRGRRKAEKRRERDKPRASMSFLTALSLSFRNLLTKKGRTILTAFAGSIGIVGIALILALSNGVNTYIMETQRDTMASYPITITAQAFDLSSLLEAGEDAAREEVNHDRLGVHANPTGLKTASSMFTSITENNLTAFKEYLDDPSSAIHEYIGEHGVVYSYDLSFSTYARDPEGTLVNTDGSTFESEAGGSQAVDMMTMMTTNSPIFTGRTPSSGGIQAATSMGGSMTDVPRVSPFQEIIPGPQGDPVGSIVENNYELVEGQWPSDAESLILVLDQNNEIPTSVLYSLGLLPAREYREILDALEAGETPMFDEHQWDYDELIGYTFKMLTASDYFEREEGGTFVRVTDEETIERLVDERGKDLVVVGIVRPIDASSDNPLTGNIGYTNQLTSYIVEHTDVSAVVEAQKQNPEMNVLTGVGFDTEDEEEKITDAKQYLRGRTVSEKAAFARSLILASAAEEDPTVPQDGQTDPTMPADPSAVEGPPGASGMPPAMNDEVALAGFFDNYLDDDPSRDFLLNIFNTQLSGGTYDGNLSDFGVVSLDSPSSINIYVDSFEDKDGITASIDAYNETASAENQIVFTDYIGLLMSTITTIINVISYVLIAFVAVSLLVSSIMIGIITFISVLERTKEIGILRSVGASKRNISEVFNAETLIVGFLAGVFGIGMTLLILIPSNILIHHFTGIDTVNATLPWAAAFVLVGLSMLLTVVAGVIPARFAARKDPVAALRTD